MFQGRFKAVIVQRESYLLKLARYVVLNPVRAGMCALPELWPWSSYRATVGSAAPPEWLQTAWLLSQFGGQPETASDAYIGHVRAGIGLASVWAQLKSQLYLGDDDFSKALQQHTQGQAGQTEIPKAQRRATAPPLAHFVTLPERNSAMAQAYATGCYSLKEIGHTFGLHYATVSRAVRAAESTAGS